MPVLYRMTLVRCLTIPVYTISIVMTMRWATKCLHKNIQCMKSIKEDDDGSQPGSKVNGDHRIPRRTKISSAAVGSASLAR